MDESVEPARMVRADSSQSSFVSIRIDARDARSELRRFLESVGEEFEILTNGYFVVWESAAAIDRMSLRCECDDEVLEVGATVGNTTTDAPGDLAEAIAARFDRSRRAHATAWVVLAATSLEDLAARVRASREGAAEEGATCSPVTGE